MIPNCKGCEYEFQEACDYVKSGYHLAATKERVVGLGEKKHFGLMIVDNNGKLIVL